MKKTDFDICLKPVFFVLGRFGCTVYQGKGGLDACIALSIGCSYCTQTKYYRYNFDIGIFGILDVKFDEI